MADEALADRSSRVLLALATVGATIVLGCLALALARTPPARDVAFVGGWDDDNARCRDQGAWNGKVAWTTCDWFYRDRALVELDPEDARATVLHRWSIDDGNVPALKIVRPCNDGQLFIIDETRQTTVVTRRAAGISASTASFPGPAVLGAECGEGRVDLFVAEANGYAIHRVDAGKVERLRTIGAAEVPGSILGAWFEGGAWHAVVRVLRGSELLFGKLGSPLSRIDGTGSERSVCLIGEPGGWLGTDPGSLRHDGVVVSLENGAFRVTRLGRGVDALVVQTGPEPGFGVTLEGADAKLFRGPGALGLELRRRGSVFEAQRGSAAPVVVAASSFSSLDLGALALPLSGERVAVWGGLGSQLVILGPDLRRLDEPGIVQRTLRPLTRFRASAKSTFDRICYAILLVSSVGWLLALPILRRRDMRFKRARLAAALFVALLVVGATGFYNVIVWI